MPEQSLEILASLAYVNDLNTVIDWAVDDEVAGTRDNEAAMIRSEFRPGATHMRLVSESETGLAQSLEESSGGLGIISGDVFLYLFEVTDRLVGKLGLISTGWRARHSVASVG